MGRAHCEEKEEETQELQWEKRQRDSSLVASNRGYCNLHQVKRSLRGAVSGSTGSPSTTLYVESETD